MLHKRPELELRIKDLVAVLLTETWLNQNNRINIRNFDTVRADRKIGRGRGVAILVKKSIKYSHVEIPFNCNDKLECCAIRISWGNARRPLILVALYKRPKVYQATR